MSKSQLALLGGTPPVIFQPAPHFPWPLITERTKQAVLKQMDQTISIYDRSGIFAEFEDRWNAYHGTRYSLLTSSGTMGLFTMFVACELGAGDEVIVPAYTFHATASPLLWTGATPILCDCDESGNIDPNALRELITSHTKAVVVTHLWGVPAQMDAISEICQEHGLLLLEDCSHAHGATYQGRLVGTWGDVAVWSLQGQKVLTGGEGGILSTNDQRIYEMANLVGQYNKRCKKEIDPHSELYQFYVTGMGFKLRAHPLAIAIANEQFDHLDIWRAQKSEFAHAMIDRLSRLPGLRMPLVPPNSNPSWYAFVMQYQSDELGGLSLRRFHEALVAEGALEADLPGSTTPLNELALFQNPGALFPQYTGTSLSYHPGQFQAAERFSAQALKLPVWVRPEDADLVELYIQAIEKVIQHHTDLL